MNSLIQDQVVSRLLDIHCGHDFLYYKGNLARDTQGLLRALTLGRMIDLLQLCCQIPLPGFVLLAREIGYQMEDRLPSEPRSKLAKLAIQTILGAYCVVPKRLLERMTNIAMIIDVIHPPRFGVERLEPPKKQPMTSEDEIIRLMKTVREIYRTSSIRTDEDGSREN